MKFARGFSLIELMVTVVIIAALATVAYPSYRKQVMRANRAEARNALLQIQVAQEKYFLQNNSYGALTALGLGYASATPRTTNGYFELSLGSSLTATAYTATATAQGGQANDTGCTALTITQTGARGPSTGNCWK